MSEEKLIEKPGYYAIIPANVRYDKTLSPNAKLLYGEITCLLQFNNKCFASNQYFARLYEVSEVQISRLVAQLVKQGYIKTETEITSRGTRRLIKIPLNIFDDTGVNKNKATRLIKNDKHNKHSNTIPSLLSKEDCDVRKIFIDEFNKKRNSNFRLTKKLKEELENVFKDYSYKDALVALDNAMQVQYHIDNEFNDLTPEFITRVDKLEKYLNYQVKKKHASGGATLTF